jgi:peptidyl-prolyl cis-trans isomerase SurA
VNGEAVTEYDIDQRTLLLESLGAEEDVRSLATQQLTEERLKVQAARRLGLELSPEQILAGVEEFAATRGMSVDDVLGILQDRGIDRETLNDFVEAGLVWRELIGARFRQVAIPTDAEVEAALARQVNTPVTVYYLAEIALPFSERGQQQTMQLADQLLNELSLGGDFSVAAAQFSRSDTARSGGTLAPMIAETMPPGLREEVEALRVGQVAGPVPIGGGVAIVKLLDTRQELPEQDPDVAREERLDAVRRELFAARVELYGEGLLQELMSDAIIVRP